MLITRDLRNGGCYAQVKNSIKGLLAPSYRTNRGAATASDVPEGKKFAGFAGSAQLKRLSFITKGVFYDAIFPDLALSRHHGGCGR